MYTAAALATLSLFAAVRGQNVGTNKAEVHPSLRISQCSAGGTCTAQTKSIVLDSNWRWTHATTGYTNCYTGNAWNATACPDPATCTANCAIDGADYSGTYGISTSGDALTLKFVTKGENTNVGSRVYLLEDETHYKIFSVLNAEFTFDVDMSALPCGLNGALYFSEMQADGGMAAHSTNKAGAKYGTGYCDAQCPHDIKWINGEANSDGWTAATGDPNGGSGKYGTCCPEMDIWEANKAATAYTPHPCSKLGPYRCSGTECGDGDSRYSGVCDKDGCDFNSWRMGDKTFIGEGLGIDTTKKVTVVTQFITNTGTSTGTLSEIRRFYVQNGVTYANSVSKVAGIDGNSISDSFCKQQKTVFDNPNDFATKGGLVQMGKSFQNGVVLVMSIWDDWAANLLWLDSSYPIDADPLEPGVNRGPCPTTSGNPKELEAQSPNASVTFSNIKYGPLGSTFKAPSGGSSALPAPSSTRAGSSSSTRAATTTSRPATTSTRVSSAAPSSSSVGGTVAKYGQCGGRDYKGATQCVGSTCTVVNDYYSQCL